MSSPPLLPCKEPRQTPTSPHNTLLAHPYPHYPAASPGTKSGLPFYGHQMAAQSPRPLGLRLARGAGAESLSAVPKKRGPNPCCSALDVLFGSYN